MAWDGFDASTRGEKSRAMPAVFDNKAGFDAAGARLENETSKLASLAAGRDEAAIKAQIQAVGKACAGCHQDFRAK
jgi:cytochrome c556